MVAVRVHTAISLYFLSVTFADQIADILEARQTNKGTTPVLLPVCMSLIPYAFSDVAVSSVNVVLTQVDPHLFGERCGQTIALELQCLLERNIYQARVRHCRTTFAWKRTSSTEAVLAWMMSHHGGVPVLFVGNERLSTSPRLPLPCIAMPVLQDIQSVVDTDLENISQRTRCMWATQLCRSLHYLHSQHALHRDISPGNILISFDRQTAYLGDYGSAIDETERNSLIGAHRYPFAGTDAFGSDRALSENLPPSEDDDWTSLIFSLFWAFNTAKRWAPFDTRPCVKQAAQQDKSCNVVYSFYLQTKKHKGHN